MVDFSGVAVCYTFGPTSAATANLSSGHTTSTTHGSRQAQRPLYVVVRRVGKWHALPAVSAADYEIVYRAAALGVQADYESAV